MGAGRAPGVSRLRAEPGGETAAPLNPPRFCESSMAASLWMGDVSVRPGPARGVVRRTAGRCGLRAPAGLRELLGDPAPEG